MKKITLLIFIVTVTTLFSLSLEYENIELKVIHNEKFAEIISSESSFFSDEIGSPAIPIITQIVEIPYNKTINSATITPINLQTTYLTEQLKAVPENIPLSSTDLTIKSNNIDISLSREIYNQGWTYKIITGKVGSYQLAFISIYSCKYNPDNQQLTIPQSFSIDLQLHDLRNSEQLGDNYATNSIIRNFRFNTRNEAPPSYLVIYPQSYQNSIEPLTNWRSIQGLDVHQISIEEISNQYNGIDLQTKIRQCIQDFYQEYTVSHVTLIGDVAQLPDRKLYAFDCAFGAYDDENDIPADIYYAGLNGDWDANGNGIYGEDDDEPDFLPEVFISRIPASDTQELDNYISMLLPYEQGNFSNLNKAGGFSMELWPESGSYQCQQYIYDSYFPSDYDIEFIYHDENTTENAYDIINSNRNIVQHTGHAGKTILSLQNGYIRNENLENMANDWGGIFYSIGCWSAALDYDSVGENLVTWADHGFLGYVGNSRYGWGAPSAPGFGFSEFYQKEFMRLIFEDQITSLAELNTLQKLPFVPYWSGTSVYKWVGYELNALGDSYFNIQTHDPEDFSYDMVWIDNQLELSLHKDGMPLANVIVTCDSSQLTTDYSGVVTLNCQPDDIIHLYKSGYQYKSINVEDFQPKPYISNLSNLNYDGYLQGMSSYFDFNLNNPTDEDYQVTIMVEPDNQFITLELDQEAYSLESNTSIDNIRVPFYLKSIAETQQLDNGFNIPLYLKIIDSVTDEILAEKAIGFTIKAPTISIIDFRYSNNELEINTDNLFQFTVENIGNMPVYGVDIDFISDNVELQNQQLSNNTLINTGESISFYNSWNSDTALNAGLMNISITTNLGGNQYRYDNNFYISTSEIAIEESFESDLQWESDPYWQPVDYYATDGSYSLSCRPEMPGYYDVTIPSITYLNNSVIEFNYKYKMPMYGKDGVFLILNSNTITDTLLFLGAGGALPDITRDDAQVYIESDWAYYKLDLDANTTNQLDPGDQYNLILRFVYSEEIEGFNQYNLMYDIGVFIDQFKIGESWSEFEQPYSDDISLKLYPNPISDFHWLTFEVLSGQPESITIDIYNIRGQRIRSIPKDVVNQGENLFFWDKKDLYGREVAAGIYLIKIKIANHSYYRKVLLLN